jgi:hypothetical protein
MRQVNVHNVLSAAHDAVGIVGRRRAHSVVPRATESAEVGKEFRHCITLCLCNWLRITQLREADERDDDQGNKHRWTSSRENGKFFCLFRVSFLLIARFADFEITYE